MSRPCPSAHPPVRNEILDELRAAIDAADLEVILSVFQTDVDAQLADLQDFASNGQHDAARRIAHRLAGLLAQFGAKEASELAHRMAAAASNPGDAAAIAAVLSKSHQAVAEICACQSEETDAPAPVLQACKPAPNSASRLLTGRPSTLPPQMAAEIAFRAAMQYPTHRRRSEPSGAPSSDSAPREGP